jgi:sterol desaturase/sphingolipid hydroxylase (fatty acid hydroxylase superfamily)
MEHGSADEWMALAPWVMAAIFVAAALAERPFAARAETATGLRRPATNLLLGILALLLAALIPASLTAFAAWVGAAGHAPFALPPMPLAIAATAALLLRSFSAYWAHRASHRIGWLWRLHRVHHADTAIDATTGFRHHPVEQFVSLLFALPAIWLFALPPAAVAIAELVLIAAGIAEHANIRTDGRGWRAAAWLFATPAVHLVHHSSRQAQTDSNYGSLFSVWDRLFGTWRDPATEPVERIGLGDAQDRDADRWRRQLLSPFVRDP